MQKKGPCILAGQMQIKEKINIFRKNFLNQTKNNIFENGLYSPHFCSLCYLRKIEIETKYIARYLCVYNSPKNDLLLS